MPISWTMLLPVPIYPPDQSALSTKVSINFLKNWAVLTANHTISYWDKSCTNRGAQKQIWAPGKSNQCVHFSQINSFFSMPLLDELEALLRQKANKESTTLVSTALASVQPSTSAISTSPTSQSQQLNLYTSGISPTTSITPKSPLQCTSISTQNSGNHTASNSFLTWSSWPSNLPGPELLRHL